MMMPARRALLLSPLLFALITARVPALSAPAADLVGKSIIVAWTENRQQRVGGRPEIRPVKVTYDLRIYVSAAARPFTRLTANTPSGPLTNEQVGGEGTSLGGGLRVVKIDDRSITLQAVSGNYARSLQIEVAQGGQNCSAKMSVGKEPGSSPIPFQNMAGLKIEIHALTASATACSVQPGNVFGR